VKTELNILWSLRPSQLTFVVELIGGSSDSDWVRKTLRPLLNHKSRIVREGVIYGLEGHVSDELRNVLLAMAASDPSQGVRQAAADAAEL
jgi:hypothetical protein